MNSRSGPAAAVQCPAPAHVTYSVQGLKFHINFTITGYDAGSRLESSVEGGMEGSFTWSVQPEGGAARLGMYVDYRVKGGMAGAVLGVVLIIPLRKQKIDLDRLRFPSGIAVATIIRSGARNVLRHRA